MDRNELYWALVEARIEARSLAGYLLEAAEFKKRYDALGAKLQAVRDDIAEKIGDKDKAADFVSEAIEGAKFDKWQVDSILRTPAC